MKFIIAAAVVIAFASPASAQSGYHHVQALHCPSDSPRYGWRAHRDIRWCYAGPRGTYGWLWKPKKAGK